MMDTWIHITKDLGFPVAVAGFLLWERHNLLQRLDEHQIEQLGLLRSIVQLLTSK